MTINNPLDGFHFPFGLGVPVLTSVTNSPTEPVTVDYFADGTHLGMVTAPPYEFTAPLTNAGTYVLTASATATNGIVNTSAPVTVAVLGFEQYGVFSPRRLKDGAVLFDYANSGRRFYCIRWAEEFQSHLPTAPRGTDVRGVGTYLDVEARNVAQRFYWMIDCP